MADTAADDLRDARIYVAGHRGLAGSAVLRALTRHGCRRLITRSHAELELTDTAAVAAFFAAERPEVVVLCAARVGGIAANATYPADFIRTNLAIQDNVIHQGWLAGVRRLVFLGSSCIYPRDCPQPMREEYLLTGPLEPTNRPYAVAKIAGIEMCWSYNRQHGTRYLALMPTNLYGPGDNYDLETSHVLPALIRKCHEAKEAGRDRMEVWGTGRPRREFLWSGDLGDAVVHVLGLPASRLEPWLGEARAPLINVGAGEDLSIAELARLVQSAVGFEGGFEWSTARPDGAPRKLLDVSVMRELGWRASTPLEEGIRMAYADYLESRAAGHGN